MSPPVLAATRRTNYCCFSKILSRLLTLRRLSERDDNQVGPEQMKLKWSASNLSLQNKLLDSEPHPTCIMHENTHFETQKLKQNEVSSPRSSCNGKGTLPITHLSILCRRRCRCKLRYAPKFIAASRGPPCDSAAFLYYMIYWQWALTETDRLLIVSIMLQFGWAYVEYFCHNDKAKDLVKSTVSPFWLRAYINRPTAEIAQLYKTNVPL